MEPIQAHLAFWSQIGPRPCASGRVLPFDTLLSKVRGDEYLAIAWNIGLPKDLRQHAAQEAG